jgi:RNA polymerase sigma factor (sigma-70 family)
VGLDSRPVSALFNSGTAVGLSDAELLARLSDNSRAESDAALAALIARHGPMVLGVCRRTLADQHDVEDAFQATFLVLVRKAGSVRVDDSLGRWLYGVSRKVAGRARLLAARRPVPAGDAAESWPARPSAETELALALDEEIERLPRRYRDAVTMCYLEGLALRDAALRIGCPIGTVGSRLSRARDLLRLRLLRRGLGASAAVFLSAIECGDARAAVPQALAARVSQLTSEAPAATVSAAANILATAVSRRISMTKAGIAASIIVLFGLGAAGAGAVLLASAQHFRKPIVPDARGENEVWSSTKSPTRADRLRMIVGEFQAAQMLQARAQARASTKNEMLETAKLLQDTIRYTDRVLALALEQPADSVSRGAALWIVEQSLHYDEVGSWGAKVKQAMDLLVAHHADSPLVGRVCLLIDDHISPNRVPFFESLLARTKSREVRALATYSLGTYLGIEAETIESIRNGGARMTFTGGGDRLEVDPGESAVILREMSVFFDSLKKKDPAIARARAVGLLNDVIEHYGDLRDTRVSRQNPGALDATRARSLAVAAAAALRDIQDLREGKVAPEIDGKDLTGAPVRLANCRGKVVLVIFWSTWGGPCLSQVPHEIALLKKMDGRPFAILGVNTDATREDAAKSVRDHGMTWTQVLDGDPSTGKVAALYNVKSFPTVYLIDAAGVIRSKGEVVIERLDDLIEQTVKEAEAKTEQNKRARR